MFLDKIYQSIYTVRNVSDKIYWTNYNGQIHLDKICPDKIYQTNYTRQNIAGRNIPDKIYRHNMPDII